ncbi:uracil-DNA glycosylase [Actinoplanes sp. M2I2]|uniref:uracil-DNA glycosylase n=1 Tax=Actinoplanes sp. M2I2 TaxID=1734444 RepID=UPI002021C408|nr:uracil-DNA glycosylase [Actinoplanes sp. M2I2]
MTLVRQMAEQDYRQDQERNRYARHVRPVNELVDRLSGGERGWMPQVAPAHGGVDAVVLSVLRDPGPMTQVGKGSGFLSIENDDPTAEQQCVAFAQVGLRAADITPWNAYPWYINRKPDAAQLEAGVQPLVQLLNILSSIKVVLLQGGDARDVWRRLTRKHPGSAEERHLVVIETYHPGRQALWSPDPQIRAQRRENRELAYQQTADAVHA